MAAPARTRMEDSCILIGWELEGPKKVDIEEWNARFVVWFDL